MTYLFWTCVRRNGAGIFVAPWEFIPPPKGIASHIATRRRIVCVEQALKHDYHTNILRDEAKARELGTPTIVAVTESRPKMSDCHKGRVFSRTSRLHSKVRCPLGKEREEKRGQC